MIGLFGLIGLASAQCDVALPSLERGERWSGLLTVEGPGKDCRSVSLGKVSEHAVLALKGRIRQWDSGRMRFGMERLVRDGEEWRVELPEWREDDHLRLKLTVEAQELGDQWLTPRKDLGLPQRTEVTWQASKPLVFGEGGTVSLLTAHAWSAVAGPGTYAVFSPSGAIVQDCEVGEAASRDVQPFGCVINVDAGKETSLTVRWVEDGVGLSREWQLAEGQTLTVDGAVLRSSGRLSSDGSAEGPGSIVVHLETLNGEVVEPVALAEVEASAKLVSIPEPGLGLRFKGRQTDDALVKDILDLVREQVQSGRLSGRHPLKARALMDVRRSGWGTPWEQALLLSRYLGQMKLDAKAFPVRPREMGRALEGAPEGYTHAVVRVRQGQASFWLDPSCRTCSPGEISTGLWGGQVFSSEISALPEGP